MSGAIGLYLVRCSASGASVTLAHLVESEIADRVVTNCGHQMERRNRRGSLRTAGPLDGECSFCPPRPAAGLLENSSGSSQVERSAFKRGELARMADLQEAATRTCILQASEDVPEPVASEQDDSGLAPV